MADRARLAGAFVLAVVGLGLTSCTSTASPAPHTTGPSTPAPSTPAPTAATGAPTRTPAAPFRAAGSRLIRRAIPGGASHFAARPAVIYLPPAARTHPRERFPVLMLLHGTAGGPVDWTARGGAGAILDRFARAHGGRAPIVVMPDINGSTHADTECVRTKGGGDVERYLRDVVPAWIRSHLPVSRSARRWGIAGASEGGTCALMLALRGSGRWTFVGDYSGLRRPTVGPTDDTASTVDELFGGSRAAYDAHDPTLLLRRHRYPALSVWFECGAADSTVAADQAAVATLARRSVHAVHASATPGQHTWTVFAAALGSSLPWFWARAA